MPELPEVNTTVKGLQRVLVGSTISNVLTDLAFKNKEWKIKERKYLYKNTFKDPNFYKKFQKKY